MSSEKALKLAVLGVSVSSGNRGVSALATALLNVCADCMPGVSLCLLLSHDKLEKVPFRIRDELWAVPVIPARLSPRSRPRDHLALIVLAALVYHLVPWPKVRSWIARSVPWIGALEQADWVGDIRGGDSFSDLYGLRRFLLGFLMAWSVILVKGSIVQFPQTFGPYRSRIAQWLARYLLRRSSAIIARDTKSQKLAEDLLGGSKRVWVSPDVAFGLESRMPHTILLDPPVDSQFATKVKSRKSKSACLNIIGVNVSGLMYHGGYNRRNMFGLRLDYAGFVAELVTALLGEHTGELWLIPHVYGIPNSVENDTEACRRVHESVSQKFGSRVRVVTGEYDCYEIKGVIGLCDFFVGSRMHACIAALSQGIPCVAVAYSQKFVGVFETVQMQDWVVDARFLTQEQAIARILELYRARETIRPFLRTKAEEARTKLKDVFTRLVAEVHSNGRSSGIPTAVDRTVLAGVPRD